MKEVYIKGEEIQISREIKKSPAHASRRGEFDREAGVPSEDATIATHPGGTESRRKQYRPFIGSLSNGICCVVMEMATKHRIVGGQRNSRKGRRENYKRTMKEQLMND
jgi:hypothetical protein